MIDDQSTYTGTDLLEDVMREPEIETVSTRSLKTGVAGNLEEQVPQREDTIRPDAVRWAFNPFETIDLRNKPASCGMQFIDNVVFVKVKSLSINVPETSVDRVANLPNDPHDPNRYQKARRTSYMIARELEEHYGDKGVVIIDELTGETDDTVAAGLNQLLFGNEVYCIEDINDPEHPCPVLPKLLESMEQNITANWELIDKGTQMAVKGVAERIRKSIGQAMRSAQTRIDYAQARVLDEKQPNRTFAAAEQRCFLALGLEVPNALPFVGRSQARQSQGIDSEAIGRGIAQGLKAAGAQTEAAAAAAGFAPGIPNIPTAAKTGASANVPDDAFDVTDEDIEEAEKPGKKRR